MADTPQPEETPIIEMLRKQLQAAENLLRKPEVQIGTLAMWSSSIRFRLEKIYGKDSPLISELPARGIDRSIVDPRSELVKRVEQIQRYVKALEAVPEATRSSLTCWV